MSHTQEEFIHPQMTIQEILSLFPQKAQRIAQEITNAGLHCVGCHAATWETLEAGMRGHGYTEEAIQKLVDKLNAVLQQKPAGDSSTVTLTTQAAEKFLEFTKAEGMQGCALRFSDKMEGCSGFSYELDFSEKASDNDVVFVSQGIEIHVPKDRAERLVGSVIDYVNSIHSSGFYVENPNTMSSCGCGSSHNYSKEKSAEKSKGGCCGSSPKQDQSHDHGKKSGGCCSR